MRRLGGKPLRQTAGTFARQTTRTVCCRVTAFALEVQRLIERGGRAG